LPGTLTVRTVRHHCKHLVYAAKPVQRADRPAPRVLARRHRAHGGPDLIHSAGTIMVGLFSLLASFVIGTIVAAVERRSNEGWEVTAIATAGAISGAFVGRMLRLYVAFGELPGLICSAVGAVVLLRIY